MNTHEMRKAVEEAEQTKRAAANVANDIAYCLCGNLKNVSNYNLERLKKELRDFNIHTGRWK